MNGGKPLFDRGAIERPEAELLLHCARSRRDLEGSARVTVLLQQQVDWDIVLQLAYRHKMMPLLYWSLSRCAPGTIPASILDRLREHFRSNSLINMSLTRKLIRILKEFEEHNIAAVPYKGPVLAASVYGDLALREFNDLDILVRKEDILRAKRQLLFLEYRQENELTQVQEAAFLESQREYVFAHDDGSVVELHWAVTPRSFSFRLDSKELWERLEEVSLGGVTVPTFSVEDSLLILCVHGSKHLWHRLIWLCDVAELVHANSAIDWERLMEQAGRLGGTRMLFLGLVLANDLLGAVLPCEILHKAQLDPMVRPLAAQVRERLFRVAEEQHEISRIGFDDQSRFHPFFIKVRERLRDKVIYCAYTFLVPTVEDWELLPLPKTLFPLYFVLRPIRLATRYGRKIANRTSREKIGRNY